MTNRRLTTIVLLLFAGELAIGCSGSSSAPTAPSTTPQAPLRYPNATLTGVTLFGVVADVTPTGQRPIEGVAVYCDSCGAFGHALVNTDVNGYYSFSGDLARGGGVWVRARVPNLLIVSKAGYQDPPELPALSALVEDSAGAREVMINGDTRFDIQLVRR
jgi:hypothetical protein